MGGSIGQPAPPTVPAVTLRREPLQPAPRLAEAKGMSRRLAALAVLIALALPLSGCWVIDEIDKGQKLMDDHSDKSKQKKKDEEEATAKVASQKGALDAYFRKQDEKGATKTFSPGQVSEGIVACKVGSRVEFMTKDNCAAKGGHP
jgi:hypothetical protein